MIEIQDIFICDSINAGQFSKIDIVGLNGTGTIGVDQLPYKLITNFVIKGFAGNNIPRLNLRIKYSNINFVDIFDTNILLTEAVDNKKEIGLFFSIQTTFDIREYGFLTLEVLSDKQSLLSRKYRVVELESPNLRNAKHSKNIIFFDKEHGKQDNFVEDIISHASKSLKIVDSYIAPVDLLKLLSLSRLDIEIKIITGQKRKPIFIQEISKLSIYPKLSVRFSNNFHDRFLILNDTEFYHSGHSFKDAMKGKVSMFSKVTGFEETKRLLNLFRSTWNVSEKL